MAWAFVARYLYMQKRREAERLREEMLRKEQQARVALEQKNLQLEKAMEAAESANRTKSQFLATMSHELRTPLNAILGYSEMLEEELQDRGAQDLAPDLQKIHGAGNHLLGLINDILDLSKIEAGKMTLYSESFDIAATVRDIANTVEPLVKRNGNKLTVKIAPEIGSMYSDLTKVRQTLFNVLSNAAKFTEGGSIHLEVTDLPDSSMIQFTITDTGIGMNPEQLSKLFQAFTQADASTSRKYGGTGLGLVLSRNFCKLLGGDIKVRSEEGKGSVFTVRLPRRIEGVGTGPDAPAAASVDNGRAHVLVIDDDPNVRELMNRHLTKEGYAVSLAASGEQGLVLARTHKPDIITVDIIMPGQDGWSVLNSLKADEELRDVPVVLVSMVDEKQLGFSLGAADYIVKPINWERLSSVLQKFRPELPSNEILVVEDDSAMRDMLTRQLEKQSWSVLTAENGRIALDTLTTRTPGLILLDLMMPEMDGFAFLEELRRNKEWQHIPVIVVTAKDLSAEDLNQLEGRIKKVVQKSARTIDELMGEIRMISRTPQS
jgi:signal transduction histidine kinase/DNA-binding response OmpR family regulator